MISWTLPTSSSVFKILTESGDVYRMEGTLEIELEALTATYANEVTISEPDKDDCCLAMISLHLAPRGVDMHDAYVTGVLRLQVPLGYPDVSPNVELLDTKGISDERLALLRKQLCGAASMLAGEMALGAICEHALDWMTEHNRPEGTRTTAPILTPGLCAFCLNAMEPLGPKLSLVPNPDGYQDITEQPLVRLPCYHAFHRSCYTTWWRWRQKSLEAQERELVNHTGASAASVLRVDAGLLKQRARRQEPMGACGLGISVWSAFFARCVMCVRLRVVAEIGY
ncbi:hypothetical protein Vafri_18417 [Volvox africanus]|uniref:RWD domain-containing protein n=1 Tax=Volvox africanus TaxID=51714 RepID=A0A8J4BMA1_9CHLO|nr:hypothetical protein Vafri_18417 [Volvox africanus]